MKIIDRILDLIPEYDMESICAREEMLLFDIETTGLRKETTQLYLIGCAFYKNEQWNIRQWLTQSLMEEAMVLEDFIDFANEYSTLVHFNGDRFDIPYLQYKIDYYGLGFDLTRLCSFDIYKHAKRSRKMLEMSSMSQKSIEQFLGVDRDDKMNGGELIPFYYSYERTKDAELESLLLLHNYDDIQGMIKILPILSYEAVINGKFEFCQMIENKQYLLLKYQLQSSVPKNRDKLFDSGILLSFKRDQMCISLPIISGIGKMPVLNASDYYYLPDEDQIIHKDLAQFVDKSRKQRASRKNCFIKKEGRFVPIPDGIISPMFHIGNDRKTAYCSDNDFIKIGASENAYKIAKEILNLISCC